MAAFHDTPRIFVICRILRLAAENTAPPVTKKMVNVEQMIPLAAGTAIFAIIFIVGPFLVKKGPNKGIIQCSIMLSAFGMYAFWATVYISQMNPLVGPRHRNTTLMWMRYKAGAKPASILGETKPADKPADQPAKTEDTPAEPENKELVLRQRLVEHSCHDRPENIFECCNIPWIPKNTEARCIKKPYNVVTLTCTEARCVFRDLEWSEPDGNLNIEKAADFYNNLAVGNRNWVDAVRQIKIKCLQAVPKFQGIYTTCPQYDILYCVMVTMFKHGAPEIWSTASACAATRHFVAGCPICPEMCLSMAAGDWETLLVCQACTTF